MRKRLTTTAAASATVTRSPAVNAQVNDKVAAVDEAIVTFEQRLVNGLRNLGWLPDGTQDLQDNQTKRWIDTVAREDCVLSGIEPLCLP